MITLLVCQSISRIKCKTYAFYDEKSELKGIVIPAQYIDIYGKIHKLERPGEAMEMMKKYL